MTKCKECGQAISDKAETCPHCGVPLATKQKEKPSKGGRRQFGCGSLILVVIVLGAIASMLDPGGGTGTSGSGSGSPSSSSTNWRQEDNSTMAYIMMEDFVKNRLKSPSTTEFPGVWDGRADHIRKVGAHTYEINSYVDAENSFGASIRTRFTGTIKQISKDEWQLQSLALHE